MGKKLKIFFIDDDIALGHICTRIMRKKVMKFFIKLH